MSICQCRRNIATTLCWKTKAYMSFKKAQSFIESPHSRLSNYLMIRISSATSASLYAKRSI